MPPAVRRLMLTYATRAIARIRPVAPPAAWQMILAARSAAGEGPLVLPPHGRRAVVLAPHPDDETIGCGGTVARLAGMGTQITVAVATSGEFSVAEPGQAERVAGIRQSEAASACRILDTRPPVFLGLPDGVLSEHLPDLTSKLEELIESTAPDVVFVPWPLDGHPDHGALSAALAPVRLPESCEVWCYEVWAALPANRIVDVTETWERKVEALRCHSSGRDSFDLESHLALSRWRSIFGLAGFGQAEAFLVLGPEQFRELAGH